MRIAMVRAFSARVARTLGFAQIPPTNLGVFRIVLFAYLIWSTRLLDSSAWLPFIRLLWRPVHLLVWFHLEPFGGTTLVVLDAVFRVALLCSCVGLFTRTSAAVATLLGAYLFGLSHSLGKIDHSDAGLVFVMAAFALSRAGDYLSIDHWLRRRRDPTVAAMPEPSVEYAWPLVFVWLILAIIYFGAGLSKYLQHGYEWAFSHGMRHRLLRHHYHHEPPTTLGLYVAEYPLLCQWLAAVALTAEMAAPLALLHRWLRWTLFPLLFAMQVGIWLMLGIRFYTVLVLFTAILPWHDARVWVRAFGVRLRSAPARSIG